MALVTFEDLPSTNTPLNAANLNNNFDECFKTGDIVYSGDITATGTYSFTTDVSNYRFFIVELSTSSTSQRAYCIVPGSKIISNNSMWISGNIAGEERYARVSFETTYLSVLTIEASTHIRSVRGLL